MKTFPVIFCLAAAALIAGLAPVEAQSCDPLPSGALGWWEGSSNTFDTITGIEGTWAGQPVYALGEVGTGFYFDGSSGGIDVAPASAMETNIFTIEAWVQRADLDETSQNSIGGGAIVSHGVNSWVLAMDNSGRPYLSMDTVGAVGSSFVITDTSFHHIAVTADGANVTFYVDGTEDTPISYAPPYGFGQPVCIGANPDGGATFWGVIDEPTVYGVPLAPGDIQAIYQAGSAGKCAIPNIVKQPASVIVDQGSPATFSVDAVGGWPLSYQWLSNSIVIDGATNSVLNLQNTTLAESGASFSVMVSNSDATITSSNAIITVFDIACFQPIAGLVGFWTGNNTTADVTTRDNGILSGGATYAAGTNGMAFAFENEGDGVLLGNPPQLQLQNFSVVSWIARSTTNSVSANGQDAVFFSYGGGGYGFAIHNGDQMFLTDIGVDSVAAAGGFITDLNFHQVAVTMSNFTVAFYLDGMPVSTNAYERSFSFTTQAAIGERGDGGATFQGLIQDAGVYNRALSADEIARLHSAGTAIPCIGPPTIVSQPPNQTNVFGATGNYNVSAASTLPLVYQWEMNGASLVNETNSALVISNLTLTNIGTYSVVVSNADGFVSSSNFVVSLEQGVSITNQPQSEIAGIGGSATFNVTADGTPPLFYQWQFDGTNIDGATNTVYTVTNISIFNIGTYQVIVNNSASETNSREAQLSLNPEITINGQVGTNFAFTNFEPTVAITTAFVNGTIFYTLDGSTPDINGNLYSGPFTLVEPEIIRAVAYDTNFNSALSLPVKVVVIVSNTLTVTQTGGGLVTLNPQGGLFASTQTIQATATPSNGWVFMNWAGTVSGASPVIEIPMTNAQSIHAVFGTFLTLKSPPTNGMIVFNPANGPFAYGSTVQVTAVPNAGSDFSLWGGNLSGTANPDFFTVNSPNPTAAALFGALAPGHFTVTVVANGSGIVNAVPNNNSYVSNSTVNIVATPIGGSRFYYWTGSTNTSLSNFRISVRSNTVLVANFSNGVYAAQLSSPEIASNKLKFSLEEGLPQAVYEVDVSTDLVNWTPFAVATNANGTIPLADVTTNGEQKFYRAEAQ